LRLLERTALLLRVPDFDRLTDRPRLPDELRVRDEPLCTDRPESDAPERPRYERDERDEPRADLVFDEPVPASRPRDDRPEVPRVEYLEVEREPDLVEDLPVVVARDREDARPRPTSVLEAVAAVRTRAGPDESLIRERVDRADVERFLVERVPTARVLLEAADAVAAPDLLEVVDAVAVPDLLRPLVRPTSSGSAPLSRADPPPPRRESSNPSRSKPLVLPSRSSDACPVFRPTVILRARTVLLA